MVVGTYLATLDNNFNSEKGQEDIGKYKYKIAWKKTTHKRVGCREGISEKAIRKF